MKSAQNLSAVFTDSVAASTIRQKISMSFDNFREEISKFQLKIRLAKNSPQGGLKRPTVTRHQGPSSLFTFLCFWRKQSEHQGSFLTKVIFHCFHGTVLAKKSITILLSKIFEFSSNAVIFFLKKKKCDIFIEEREKQNKSRKNK